MAGDPTSTDLLALLEDQIDVTRVPFSTRGSRLLVFKYSDRDQLYIKLAERLTAVQPGLDIYRFRPPYIQDLCFIDGDGMPLSFRMTTLPHALMFRTRLGTFVLTFERTDTVAIGLPRGGTAGIRFRVSTQMWQQSVNGGSLKAVRNLAYRTNGELLVNELSLERDVYLVELACHGQQDDGALAIHLQIRGDFDLDGEVRPFSETLACAELQWRSMFDSTPVVLAKYREKYAYAWWVMMNNLVAPLGRVTHEAMMPAKVQYVGVCELGCLFSHAGSAPRRSGASPQPVAHHARLPVAGWHDPRCRL